MDLFTLLVLMFLLSAAAAKEIFHQTVSLGDDVTLSCEAGDGFIRAVEWTRPDLKKGEYVLFYSDGHSDPKQQHESFRDRVQLVDRQPQDRDVSLILKNVNNNDAGTYECRVSLDASRRKKRGVLDEEPICVIHLMVEDRGPHGAAEPTPLLLTVMRHLLVVFPYCSATALMLSVYRRRSPGRKQPVSMTMSPTSGDDDPNYDDVDADVTTEHHF
ncbi:uncharacterized protein LOC131989770 [Centropristis striata]|uniref:uncharacterized protein LOC131989770 n=1 Tax=Centropristis striata TaxID=184440 RepID=UPI0027E1369B|nr:uncharacterized protein LOC131989770 [Centropristis striata]